MARENTINLIDEFVDKQKNNDIILLTTFCFDPYFFTDVRLRPAIS